MSLASSMKHCKLKTLMIGCPSPLYGRGEHPNVPLLLVKITCNIHGRFIEEILETHERRRHYQCSKRVLLSHPTRENVGRTEQNDDTTITKEKEAQQMLSARGSSPNHLVRKIHRIKHSPRTSTTTSRERSNTKMGEKNEGSP